MLVVMRVALASRAPRNTPGKTRLLFIWLGKSLRPVPTTAAPAAAARSGMISGTGVGHGEDDRVLGHGGDHFGSNHVCDGEADENVRAAHGLGDAAGAVLEVGGVEHGLLDGSEVGPSAVDDADAVDKDDVLCAIVEQQLGGGDAACPRRQRRRMRSPRSSGW